MTDYTTGNGTETAPNNAYSCVIEVQAKGGDGGNASAAVGGGGGGGGGYSKKTVTGLTGGDTISYNTNTGTAATLSGGTKGFASVSITANNGSNGANGSGGGGGGNGGTSSGGDSNLSGNPGNAACCGIGGTGGQAGQAGVISGATTKGDGGLGGNAPSGSGIAGVGPIIRFTYTLKSINKVTGKNHTVTRAYSY